MSAGADREPDADDGLAATYQELYAPVATAPRVHLYVAVACADRPEQERVLSEMKARGYDCRAVGVT